MAKTTPYICESEQEFLVLKGEGAECVKITVDLNPDSAISGWYVFF